MVEQQGSEVLELADRVVSRGDSLAALLAGDADADVRLGDHGDIVGAITNREHSLVAVELFHEFDKVAFLLGAHTT